MTQRRRRTAIAATVATTLSALAMFAAAPAGAHGSNGPAAQDFRSLIRGIQPPTDGITVGLGPDREQIELHVSGSARVTVLGYRGEPYLRVDGSGAFENRASPAVDLNRTRIPSDTTAKSSRRDPQWHKISDRPVLRWHDHRAHWMGGATPAVVRRAPDQSHIITSWHIPIRVDGRGESINGAIQWTPPPPAWPWWILAGILAVGLFAAARGGIARLVLGAAVTILAGAEAAHIWSSWTFTSGSTASRIGDGLPSLGAVLMSMVALIWLVRRGAWSAAPALILSGLFAFVSGGLADLSTLSHAYVPSRLAPDAARGLVAVALGLGLGTAIAGATRLRASNVNAPSHPH